MARKLFLTPFIAVILLVFAAPSALGQIDAETQNFQDTRIWEFIREGSYTVTIQINEKERVILTLGKFWLYKNKIDPTMQGLEMAGINDLNRVIYKSWETSTAKIHHHSILVQGHWITGKELTVKINYSISSLQLKDAELTVVPPGRVAKPFMIIISNPHFTADAPLPQFLIPQQPHFQPQDRIKLPGR